MPLLKTEELPVRGSGDVVLVRQAVRNYAAEIGLNLVDQTKMVTAASELARNMVDDAGEGRAIVEIHDDGSRKCVRARFEDNGPGIPDLELAMRDGYTTGQGLGLGLGGAKRLVNDFEIFSKPGQGTRIVITRWKP